MTPVGDYHRDFSFFLRTELKCTNEAQGEGEKRILLLPEIV